jgi:hypothetical protein
MWSIEASTISKWLRLQIFGEVSGVFVQVVNSLKSILIRPCTIRRITLATEHRRFHWEIGEYVRG